MSTTLIGVTTRRDIKEYGFTQFSVSEAYITSLTNSGASPVLIPLGLEEATLEKLISQLGGILFTGGGDIDPQRYGNDIHPLVSGIDEDRDQVEIQLLRDTLQAGLPFLGICRGLQLINVALGGSLYEDILDQHPNALKHQYHPGWPRDYLAHAIEVSIDSRVAHILGATSLRVNSLHHQGVNKLAPGLVAAAYAPDRIIEAFELPDYPYGLAVQWHPEWLQGLPPMQALFRSFVQAVEQRRRR